jgi:hypothetical protein
MERVVSLRGCTARFVMSPAITPDQIADRLDDARFSELCTMLRNAAAKHLDEEIGRMFRRSPILDRHGRPA